MAKYSYEFKKQVVDDYLAGNGGYGTLAVKYKIHESIIRRWVSAYAHCKDEGLRRSRQNHVYSFEFKKNIVESYLYGEQSYRTLAHENGINDPTTILRWVNDFRRYGPEALKPHKKGRKRDVEKDNREETITSKESVCSDEKDEKIKALEDELYHLRLENAFLKELRRQRLEEEARTRELRKPSAASEENSN